MTRTSTSAVTPTTPQSREGKKRWTGVAVRALSKTRILRKCVGRPFLAANEALWNFLPPSLKQSAPLRPYGCFLHSLVKLRATRSQYFGTFFLRNRMELEKLYQLIDTQPQGAPLKIAVLACSNGAEVYSIMWTIRSRRPDLKLIVHAMDISNDILEIAKKGQYSIATPELVDSPIFEYLTDEEMQAMFDTDGNRASVKPWLKAGIQWHVADARDSELMNIFGGQDIVFASKFLFHMEPAEAEKCLRNVTSLVNPGGYLFVSGADLDVRSKVMQELGWESVQDMLEEMHDGDPQVRRDWPWRYWGLEPLTKKRPDWTLRYASLFRAPEARKRLLSVSTL
jgi:chemotaxis methyl-accepting protein methylase